MALSEAKASHYVLTLANNVGIDLQVCPLSDRSKDPSLSANKKGATLLPPYGDTKLFIKQRGGAEQSLAPPQRLEPG